MSQDVLVVVEHLDGAVSEITFEMLGAGTALAAELGGRCVAALVGGTDAMLETLGVAAAVARVEGAGLAEFNPESHAEALQAIVAELGPRVLMLGHTSMGMDLASTLSVNLCMPLATGCLSVSGGDSVSAVAQLYGGKMNVTIGLGAGPCAVTMLSGASPADTGRAAVAPPVQTVAAPAPAGRIRFVELVRPGVADVDITTKEILVAVGRGIGNEDGIEVAQELAEQLDAAVAGSRPIIDSGWLPKSRQVGKSGLKVKPKLYISLGISGAPEHLEGMKDSATIIAVNSDEGAPIFGVAHYGLVADLYDICEELTEAIEDR
ncbi:MAG TPA: electron transfer flavoprotein subunit alpha/FixB family protein [Myxococcota bacterium]|nr:electron transfer flavoprotein subunit alpha/FixB family protein [Myxococcota bacterium]